MIYYKFVIIKSLLAQSNFRIITYLKNMSKSKEKQIKFYKTQKKPCIPIPPKKLVNNNEIQSEKSKEKEKNGKVTNHSYDNLKEPIQLIKMQSDPYSSTADSKDQGVRKWKIGKILGRGSGGNVFKALNTKTGVLAAVKKITYSAEDLQQSRNQLKILSKIKHLNVVNYIEDYQVDNQTWIFMECLPSTLQKFYKNFGPPPFLNYLNFAKQMIQGLAYLHKQKIVHKDLKCSNILLDSKCTIKLSDFGCSKGFEQTMSLMAYQKVGCRTFKGSVAWMAPQVINQNKYTRKTDIWSLGCTLLELATGKYPWHEKHFQGQIPAMYYIGRKGQIPQIDQNLEQSIKQLVKSCLKINPDDRLSAQQLLKLQIFNRKQK